MAGVISFRILDGGLKAKLDKLEQAAQTKALYERVGAGVLTQVQLGFRSAQDPWGFKWTPPKLRKGQPLSDTGRLRRSIRAVADNDGVTVGTNLKYARIHQFGGTITAKNAPFLAIPRPGGGIFRKKSVFIQARPYLPLNPATGETTLPAKWRAAVVSRIKAHFLEVMKEPA
jgi:phage virion morphogenesis protein